MSSILERLLKFRHCLSQREILQNCSNFEAFAELKNKTIFKFAAYSGYDPSADFLHLGNYLQIVNTARASLFGIKPIYLVGSATALIGDPSFRTATRDWISPTNAKNNAIAITQDLTTLTSNLHKYLERNDFQVSSVFKIIDNMEFYKNLEFMDYLRNYGTHFNLATLIKRDSIAERLNTSQNLSLSEFVYQTMQAIDYLNLYDRENCYLQIGGSDQWGNILNGCELIKKVRNKDVCAFTTKLLLDSTGKKFGKSEKGAIKVSENSEDMLQISQYFINQPFEKLENLFLSYTFLEIDEIKKIIEMASQNQVSKDAHEILIRTILRQICAEDSHVERVLRYRDYFSLNYDLLNSQTAEEIDAFFSMMTRVCSTVDENKNKTLVKFIKDHLLLKVSGTHIKSMIQGGGVKINNVPITDPFKLISEINLVGSCYLIFKIGKEFYTIKFEKM